MSTSNAPKIKDLRSRCSEMDKFLKEPTAELEKTVPSGQTDRDFLCLVPGMSIHDDQMREELEDLEKQEKQRNEAHRETEEPTPIVEEKKEKEEEEEEEMEKPWLEAEARLARILARSWLEPWLDEEGKQMDLTPAHLKGRSD